VFCTTSNGMTLFQELKIFVKNIALWIYSFIGFSLFFYSFGLGKAEIFGRIFIVPIFSKNSFAVQVFKIIERDLLPPGVQLIVTDPWGGFIAQVEIAVVLAFIVTLPFLLYRIMKYCSPALFDHEKRAMLKSVAMFSILFMTGGLFAYYYMIPLTFRFMYPFAASLGIITFFSLDAFMSWVIAILITTGVIFLLPIFMTTLSYLRIISPDFWKAQWRFSLVCLLVFSAVITPDQTGVTMILLFTPLATLYWGGSVLAGRI